MMQTVESCNTCRHKGEYISGEFVCGLKSEGYCSETDVNKCKGGGRELWQPSQRELKRVGNYLAGEFNHLNGRISCFKSDKQKEVYEKDKQSLIKLIPPEIVDFKFNFAESFEFPKVSFTISWFYTLCYTLKYSKGKFNLNNSYCIDCNKGLPFHNLSPLVRTGTKDNYNYSKGFRGGSITTSTDTYMVCSKCGKKYIEYGYVHQEADRDEYDYH